MLGGFLKGPLNWVEGLIWLVWLAVLDKKLKT